MKKTRFIVLTGVAALAVLTLSACGKSTSTGADNNGASVATLEKKYSLPKPTFTVDANKPSWQIDKSSAKLDWYVDYSWFTQTWGQDEVSKMMSKDMNIYPTYSAGDDNKLNAMMASGKLPDIITLDASETSLIAKASQWAFPLNVLSKVYDPYYMATATKPAVDKYYTALSSDGNLYGYPNWSTDGADYKAGPVYGGEAIVVNKQIYDEIGKPSLKTPQEFLSALQKVKALNLKDHAGNKVIPFGTAESLNAGEIDQWASTLADMLGIPVTKDGKVYDRYNDPQFKLWMTTLQTAAKDGLTDPNMLTTNYNTITGNLTNGTYFMYFEPNIGADAYTFQTASYNTYIPVDAMMSTNGQPIQIKGPDLGGWTVTFISKKCKDSQKAIELFDYMTSTFGQDVMNYGKLGQTYTMVKGVPTLNADLLALRNSNATQFQNIYAFGNHPWFQDLALYDRQQKLAQYMDGTKPIEDWTVQNNHTVYKPEITLLKSKLDDVATRNLNKIQTNYSQTFAKIVTGENVDSAMKAYEQYKTANGWSTIEKEENEQIAFNNKNAS